MYELYIYRYIYLMYDDLSDDFNMFIFSSEVKGRRVVFVYYVFGIVY